MIEVYVADLLAEAVLPRLQDARPLSFSSPMKEMWWNVIGASGKFEEPAHRTAWIYSSWQLTRLWLVEPILSKNHYAVGRAI